MKTILKRNQVIISVIAIMLIAAGYMNYTASADDALQTAALTDTEQYAELGDATLVSANLEENMENTTLQEDISQSDTANNIIVENITSTSTNIEKNTSQYFTESRLEREKMYSQMLESYQKLLENNQISESQKEIYQNEIVKINTTKNAIMITENLIKNKGFEDVIIFVNGESINIIIKAEKLEQEQIAQIQNIVSRELNGNIDNIHISCKN